MKKRVLIAVLNWGLGHATRSERIIDEVLSGDCEVHIASSGKALSYLKSRFPFISTHNLPDFEVRYNRKSAFPGLVKRGIIQGRINKKQKIWTNAFIADYGITHIISDNVYGVWGTEIPSALISHQLGLLSPAFKTFINRRLASWINRFGQVWVPDLRGDDSIAGEMLRNKYISTELHLLGNCSRFTSSENSAKKIAYLAILSGVEPQRSVLEEQILTVFSRLEGKKVLVCGTEKSGNENRLGTEIIGIADSSQIEKLIQESELVICRSGYTSVTDILKLNAKGLLIPTPGQPEQIYLAKRCSHKNWFATAEQKRLTPEVFLQALTANISNKRPDTNWHGSEIIRKFLKEG